MVAFPALATTTTVIVLGALSALGFTTAVVLPAEAASDLPWKELAGGGAAVLMFAALVVSLRDRAAMQLHVEKVTGLFAETVETVFSKLLGEHSESRKEWTALIRELRNGERKP